MIKSKIYEFDIEDMIENCEILFCNNKITLDKFSIYNSNLVEYILNQSKAKNSLLIYDKDIEIQVVYLITIIFNVLIANLRNDDSSIIDNLNYGDIVYYKSKKYKYTGIISNTYFDEEMIELKDSEESTINLKISNSHELTLYNGEDNKLDNMDSKKSTYGNKKYILSKILDLHISYFDKSVEDSIILLHSNKEELVEFINNIEIKVYGDRVYKLTELIPISYYSDKEKNVDFKGNKIRQKPIVRCICKLDVALDLIEDDYYKKTVVFLGENSYSAKSIIHSDLQWIIDSIETKKVIFIQDWNKSGKVESLINDLEDIEIYAWSSNALKDINYAYFDTINNVIIADDIKLNKLIENILENVDILTKESDVNKDINWFIAISYKLINIYSNTLINIKYYDEHKFFDRYYENLNTIISNFKSYNYIFSLMENIIQNLIKINNHLHKNNYKNDILINLKLNRKSLIVCSDKIQYEILKNNIYIKFNKVEVEYIKNLKYKHNYDKIIYSGFYDSRYIECISTNIGKEKIFLLYKNQVSKYNFKIKRYNNILLKIEDKNILSKSKSINKYELIHLNDHEEDIFNRSYKNEESVITSITDSSLEQQIDLDFYNLDILKRYDYFTENNRGCSANVTYINTILKFNDEKYMLVSKHYKAICLEDNKLIEKKPLNLEEGDNIVILKTKSDAQITNLFFEFIKSDNEYVKYYENIVYWKKALHEYMNRNEFTYEHIAFELRMNGIEKSPQTISSWFKNEIIGPHEAIFYKAIACITKDSYLVDNWEEVYNSCEKIRQTRRKFKSEYIDKLILKLSIFEKIDLKDEDYKVMITLKSNLEKYMDICKIKSIENTMKLINSSKANCILDSEDFIRVLNNK